MTIILQTAKNINCNTYNDIPDFVLKPDFFWSSDFDVPGETHSVMIIVCILSVKYRINC